MDKLTRYREIVRQVVEEYASYKPAYGQIDSYPVIDSTGDHYLAMQVGWDQQRRVQGAFLHLDVINGKVWVQYNGTNRPVAEELVAAGIPKDDVVLAEKPPHVRQYTGSAVG